MGLDGLTVRAENLTEYMFPTLSRPSEAVIFISTIQSSFWPLRTFHEDELSRMTKRKLVEV
jgi:hypothetical protein